MANWIHRTFPHTREMDGSKLMALPVALIGLFLIVNIASELFFYYSGVLQHEVSQPYAEALFYDSNCFADIVTRPGRSLPEDEQRILTKFERQNPRWAAAIKRTCNVQR